MKHIRTTQEGHDHEVCPNCGTEMCAGRIYEDWAPLKAHHRGTNEDGTPTEQAMQEYAEAYGAGPLAVKERLARLEEMGPNAFDSQQVSDYLAVNICGSKVIGIETPNWDGVTLWVYPCCGATYNRWTSERVEDWHDG